MTGWHVYSEWAATRTGTSPDRVAVEYRDQKTAETAALHLCCCAGARYVTVQSPGHVATFEWDRYTNIARRYRPPTQPFPPQGDQPCTS